jgi:hypothetical protein
MEAKTFSLSHDRFLIIDSKDIYHLGASLKDLGKKWFAFSKMEKEGLSFSLQFLEFNYIPSMPIWMAAAQMPCSGGKA